MYAYRAYLVVPILTEPSPAFFTSQTSNTCNIKRTFDVSKIGMLKVKREGVTLPFTSSDYCEVATVAKIRGRLIFRRSESEKGLSLTLQILFTIVYIDLYLENEEH